MNAHRHRTAGDGRTEEQLIKLQLVKRKMCVRGKFDLLPARVVSFT